ncbi:hypothetical protein [Tenacibaculum sp. MAR_2009_124]|uniref:hypothetical protein n=1 Tax=Tenacibaculum sp. MAR_2009_124 TaxID=1250059 RepID=UPI000B88C51E|nr:hypothetical protein [Tenacibaculum sp. MAR_2009_124]
MVILLKTGYEHLKKDYGNEKKYNPVWYNHLKYNKKPINVLIDEMFRRFEKKGKYSGAANKVNFYDNDTGKLIESKTP